MARHTEKSRFAPSSAKSGAWVREVDETVITAASGAIALERVYARVQNHPNRYVSARPLARFVPDLTKKIFQKRGFSSAQLIADWSDIIGAQWAQQCQPEKLSWPRTARGVDETDMSPPPGATLILRTDPAFALEIDYASAQIADRINAHFGYRAIAAIKINQGPLAAPRRDSQERRPQPTPAPRRTPPAQSAIQDVLDNVDDRALQAALRRLGTSLCKAGI